MTATAEKAVMPSALSRVVARRVRMALAMWGNSQADLARYIGWREVYLSRRLNGSVEPDLADIEILAGAIKITPADLMGLAGDDSQLDRWMKVLASGTDEERTELEEDAHALGFDRARGRSRWYAAGESNPEPAD